MTRNERQRAHRQNAVVLLTSLLSILPGGSISLANPCDLVVDPAKRNLVDRQTGQPFVWLGDTAWSAIKQLTRDEMDVYLDTRQQQGFTVVQVILIGHDPGPNQAGHWPFNGSWDATSPRVIEGEDDYWDNADYFIDGAIGRGMVVCALPLWRKHVHEQPLICRDETYAYGRFLGQRYRRQNARIVWCMGGDMYLNYRHGHDESFEIYHNLARGLAIGVLGEEDYSRMCMTYHIFGPHTTAQIRQLREAPWMTFHSIQSSHRDSAQEGMLQRCLAQDPAKPTIDLEPMYDDHFGASIHRTRHINWWGGFEGGFGTTMGSWNVWHLGERGWTDDRLRWESPRSYTTGFATQIRHLGALLRSRPMLERRFDPDVLHPQTRHGGKDRIYANRYLCGSCIMVYSPRGWRFKVNLDYLNGSRARLWWFNPRDGSHIDGGTLPNQGGYVEFDPPSEPGEPFSDHDWVLVLDDADVGYGPPGSARVSTKSPAGGYPLQFAPFERVIVNDSFWQPVFERNRTVTIPHVLKMCEDTGMFRDFDRAAGKLDGPAEALHISDETVYKTIESAAFQLARRPDPAMAGRLDALITRIAAAQEPDGYLHTPYQIAKRLGTPVPPPFSDNGRGLELYFCGHLYEAAAAHYRATGQVNLLAVALKNAELVNRQFGPGKRVDVSEHPEIEPALVKLYEATGDERWWRLARFFVETRGTTAGGRKLRGPFSQDHAPIREQTEAVGQAPRATYFYSGVVDVAALSGDATLLPPMHRLWDDVVGRKLYLTGGIGSRHGNEGFGDPYELPNLIAYTEVCAAVSFSMWNERMFRTTGDAKFIDALERTLYNNFLAGVSLSGDRYFYACPPQSDGKYAFNRGWLPRDRKGPHMDPSATRKEWFECACCPPNWTRWLVQVPGFIYATGSSDLFVNLFIASEMELDLGGAHWKVKQETRYPWDGNVRLLLTSELSSATSEMGIRLRIPGWARGEPVASNLYRYLGDDPPQPIQLRLNGASVPVRLEGNYAVLQRVWKSGDIIELNLPMSVRRVVAHPDVKDLAGQVAVEHGPIVYCAEGLDHGGRVLDLALADDAQLEASFDADFAGGVTVVWGQAVRGDQRVELRLIPHFAWANRGVAEMTVWLKQAKP